MPSFAKPVRVVLDTNVVASALLWGGTPERLIELAGILGRAKFAQKLMQKNVSAAEILARYRALAETIEAASIEESRLRDPDDAAVLACALAARAEAIISGDEDVLSLGSYHEIPIVSAAECLRRVSG